MPHLASFREGWRREHLAKFILSKFSFVAEPSTISDDIGSDFFCTFFKIIKIDGRNYLTPQNSFAIQIKSDYSKIDITDKVSFLDDLEIPYFVGVVDLNNLKIKIYSGEWLCYFFSHHGHANGKKVSIKLINNREVSFYELDNSGNHIINFPLVAEFSSKFDYISDETPVNKLIELCGLIQENLSSKRGHRYIFKNYGEKSVNIYAGPTSALFFRRNFINSLAEVFYNLEGIYKATGKINMDEFRSHRELYNKLCKLKLYIPLPMYLHDAVHRLNKLIIINSKIGEKDEIKK